MFNEFSCCMAVSVDTRAERGLVCQKLDKNMLKVRIKEGTHDTSTDQLVLMLLNLKLDQLIKSNIYNIDQNLDQQIKKQINKSKNISEDQKLDQQIKSQINRSNKNIDASFEQRKTKVNKGKKGLLKSMEILRTFESCEKV